MFRPVIRTPDIQHLLRGNEDDEQILELEYKYLFEGTEQDDPIYKVQILNNLRVDAGYIYSSRPVCEFCGVEHSNNCDFSFVDRSTTIKDIMRRVSSQRPGLSLVVTWRASNPCANLDLIEFPTVKKFDLAKSEV